MPFKFGHGDYGPPIFHFSRVGSAVRTTSASAASPRELAAHCRAGPIGFPICHACRVGRVTTTGGVRAVWVFTGWSAQRTLRVWVIRRRLSIVRWSLVSRNHNPSQVCRHLESPNDETMMPANPVDTLRNRVSRGSNGCRRNATGSRLRPRGCVPRIVVAKRHDAGSFFVTRMCSAQHLLISNTGT